MSSGGQIVGGVVGGIAGAFVGGPAGAYQGAALGMAIGGALDPPKGPSREGPRINDLSLQTSTYGAVIPRIYGTVGGVNGNIFWLLNNKLTEVATETEEGGKGGTPTSEVTTYSYFATFAIGICEGEIGGVRRIWAGSNLIYDAGSSDVESIKASNKLAKSFDFYTGSEAQNPSYMIQSDLGVGNVSAYRGISYCVLKDFALQIYGNAIPPIKFEIVGKDNNFIDLVGQSSDLPRSLWTGVQQLGGMTNPVYKGIYNSMNVQEFTFPNPVTSSGIIGYYADDLNPRNSAYFNKTIDPTTGDLTYNQDNGIISTPFSIYGQMDVPGSLWGMDNPEGRRTYVNITNNNGMTLLGGYTSTIPGSSQALDNIIYYDGIMLGFLNSPSQSWIEKAPANNTYPSGDRFIDFFALGYGEDVMNIAYQGGNIYCLTNANQILKFDIFGEYQGLFSPGLPVVINTTEKISSKIIEDSIWYAYIIESSGFYYLEFAEIDLINESLLRTCRLPRDSDASSIKLTLTLMSWNIDLGVLSTQEPITYDANERDSRLYQYNLNSVPKSTVKLSEIVSTESVRTGILESSDFDATDLTDTVNGYRLTKVGGIREGIVPLQGAYPFDTYQSGYIVKYAKRGRSSIATINIGDLGVNEQLKQARDMDTQLPRKVVVKYLDSGRDYDMNDQYSERINTDAVNTRTIEMPIVLGATKAAQIVESLIYLYWLERTDFGPFTLPPIYSYLEPADVITLNAQYATYELRLLTVDYKSDGSLVCSGRLNNPSVYQSDAVSDDADSDETIDGSGFTIDAIVDAPMIDETIQNRPGFGVAMSSYSSGWPGALLFRSGDGGQTWQDLQAFTNKATLGQCGAPLGQHDGDILQKGQNLNVYLVDGNLSSISEDAQLTGGNVAAYGVDGRWEIISFRTATLQPDNTYLITDFMRGLRGTEWVTGLHQDGDQFVMMQNINNKFVGVQSELIGVDRLYRSVTSGEPITSADNEEFTYQGVNLKPLSGVDANGHRDLAGDLTGTWYARTRVSSSWWTNGIPGPTGEASEAYDVDVMNGSTVVRTINTVTPEFLYTAAEQTTDFGSVQSSIDVRIYQMSEAIGRGFVYEVTL